MANSTTPPAPDPDRLPDSSDPFGPCPRCGRVSNFVASGSLPVTFEKGTWVLVRSGERLRCHVEQATVLSRGTGQPL
jgi:hypothetical protein